MNARVFLLVLVTATFMAVWDADRPAASPGSVGLVRSLQAATSQPSRNPGLIPLPANLQSGTWQVFNHDGDTIRITIDGRKDDSIAASAEEKIPETVEKQLWIVTGNDGIRWCFVKEQAKTVRQADATRQ